jgi:nitrogen regulatory protein PII 2
VKEIMAIIRINKINPTKKALAQIGIASLTVRKVMGRGKMFNVLSVLNEVGVQEEVAGKVVEGLVSGSRLIPKRMLTIVVQDSEIEKVIATLIEVNQEGNAGDGKIFVMPILDAVRVRTGESGEAAL